MYIKGIDIFSVDLGIDTLKISQYADDTTLFVESVNDIQYIMNENNDFGDYAGPKINWNKTKVMKLNIVDNFFHDNAIIYTDQPVKYLGENKKLLLDWNWNVKIDKIRNVLNMWKMRDLTFYGRIIVLKMLAASQIVYTATVVPVPKHFFLQILNRLLFCFLWNSKKDKIKGNVIISDIENGGLNMIDIASKISSLRLAWISRFLMIMALIGEICLDTDPIK